jgi:hypothetical protein
MLVKEAIEIQFFHNLPPSSITSHPSCQENYEIEMTPLVREGEPGFCPKCPITKK